MENYNNSQKDNSPHQDSDDPNKNYQHQHTRNNQHGYNYRNDPNYHAYKQKTDAQTFAMLCHLSALSGLIIPFGNILGPLIVWLLKRDEFRFVDIHGKEALNFQISITIYVIFSGILILILIGIPMLIILIIIGIIFTVIAAVKASNGETYTYPMSIKFIK